MNKKVIGNSTFLLIGNICGKLFYFLATIIIIRKAGYDTFGMFAYGLSVVMLLSTLLDLGVDKIFIREASKESKRVSDIFSIYTGKTLFFLAIIILFTIISTNRSLYFYILLFAVYVKSLLNSTLAIIESRQEMKFEARIILLGNLLFLLFIFIFPQKINFITFAYLLSAIYQFFDAFISTKLNTFKIKSPHLFFNYLKIGFPIGIVIIFSTFEFRIDTILIGNFLGNKYVGYYQSVYAIITALLLIPNAFSTSFYPYLAGIKDHSQRTIKTVIRYSLLLSGIGIIIIFIFGPLSKTILTLFYKNIEPIQIETLKILLLTLFPIFFSVPYIFFYYTRNLQKRVMWVIIFKGTLNFILNLIFIPKFGLKAAAWVMFITEMVGATLFFSKFLIQFNNKNE